MNGDKKIIEESELEKELKEMEKLEREVEAKVEEKVQEKKTEEKKEELSEEEVKKIVEKTLMDEGLIRYRVIAFEIPSMFIATKYHEDEKSRSAKIEFHAYDVSKKLQSLRSSFYNILRKFAFNSLTGWLVPSSIPDNEFKFYIDGLNNVMNSINQLLKQINYPERKVYVLEVYLPRNYIIDQLKKYIEELKMDVNEMKKKIQEQKVAKSTIKKYMSEINELEQIISKLENELRRLETQS